MRISLDSIVPSARARFARFVPLLPFALAAPLAAQAVRGGDLVATDYPNGVYRIDTTGVMTPLHLGAPLQGPSGITVAQDRDVLVADFATSTLFRIDAQTAAIATVATGLGGPLRVVELLDGDFAVTSNGGNSVLRVTPGGVVTTLASGAPLNRPFALLPDLDGSLLIVDDLGRGVYRATSAGITTVYQGLPLRLPQGIALFPNGDYAVIDGIADAVFRIDRTTGIATTWVSTSQLGVNPESIETDGAGGFVIAHSGNPGGAGVRVVDALGNATAMPLTNATWSNPEQVAIVPIVAGPTGLATGPGAVFAMEVDAPAHAGALYSLLLSASVHPGWQYPGDVRSLFVNVDAFFGATLLRDNAPVLVNWTGVVPPAGTVPTPVDLTLLPQGALAGLVLFQQGLLIDPTLTLRAATNVRRLTIR